MRVNLNVFLSLGLLLLRVFILRMATEENGDVDIVILGRGRLRQKEQSLGVSVHLVEV